MRSGGGTSQVNVRVQDFWILFQTGEEKRYLNLFSEGGEHPDLQKGVVLRVMGHFQNQFQVAPTVCFASNLINRYNDLLKQLGQFREVLLLRAIGVDSNSIIKFKQTLQQNYLVSISHSLYVSDEGVVDSQVELEISPSLVALEKN